MKSWGDFYAFIGFYVSLSWIRYHDMIDELKNGVFRLVILAFLVMLSMPVVADEYCFVVWTKRGEQISIPLIEKPKIINSGDNLIMNTTTTTVEYPKTEVGKFTLNLQEPGGIDAGEMSDCEIIHNGNIVILSGLRAGSEVKVFTIGGYAVLTGCVGDDGSLALDLSPLGQGIYIVSTENITCKIIKR